MSAAVAFNELRRAQSLVKLGDIAEFIMGQAPPGSASNFEGRGTVFVKAGEFGQSHPVVREWTTKPLRYAKSGDVLICVVGATAGKLNLGIDCAIGRSVAAIRPRDKIFDRFLYFQLLPKVLGLRASSTGSAQGVINKSMLANIELFVPEIAEQHRIVAEIEKQFTRLDAGVAALRRVQANLKRYRAAVLKAACEGRLVPTEAELAKAEGRTYEAGEQLLARILADRRKNWQGRGKYKEPATPGTTNLPTLPEGWAWASAEQLCEFITKGTTPASEKMTFGQGDVPFIKVYNLTFTGALNLEYKPAFVSRPTHEGELKRSGVRTGDVLINIVGPPLGQVSVVPPTVKEANINQAIARFRVVEPKCRAHIALCLMTADIMAWAVRRAKTTAGQTNLTLELCRELPVPLPPLEEQLRTAAEVERHLSIIEELEVAATANLRRAARLRQSILHRAFQGEH